jgi:hypothetical protein
MREEFRFEIASKRHENVRDTKLIHSTKSLPIVYPQSSNRIGSDFGSKILDPITFVAGMKVPVNHGNQEFDMIFPLFLSVTNYHRFVTEPPPTITNTSFFSFLSFSIMKRQTPSSFFRVVLHNHNTQHT